MSALLSPPPPQWINLAKPSAEDLIHIRQCRRTHNQLGFAYQLAFVKVYNRFPLQYPFEIDQDLLTYVMMLFEAQDDDITKYAARQQTVSEHQIRLRRYLGLRSFTDPTQAELQGFLFEECSRREETVQLRVRAQQFLRDRKILEPALSTLDRIIGEQRQQARTHMFTRVLRELPEGFTSQLDELLLVEEGRTSPLEWLKSVPSSPTASAILRLTEKLTIISGTGALAIDLSWLNNNYQRSLARRVKTSSVYRLRRLEPAQRYTALVCFLKQMHQDTIDFLIEMVDKLLCRITSQAEREMDGAMKQRRELIQRSSSLFQTVAGVLLDDDIPDDSVRSQIFSHVTRETLETQTASLREWTEGQYSHIFYGISRRFPYLRRFSPSLFEVLTFEGQGHTMPVVLTAIEVLRRVNKQKKRSLPDNVPMDFIPKRLRSFVSENGTVSRQVWECALLMGVRDELKSGNLAVAQSKRFGQFDQFFIPDGEWAHRRERFFHRAGLPVSSTEAPAYLTNRLNAAFEAFLQSETGNSYATVSEHGWQLSRDPAENLKEHEEAQLQRLRHVLTERMRTIRLPQLLIEVDNDLTFTRHFMNPARREERRTDEVCMVLATILALGCNIGPQTMARLTDEVSYEQIKRIVDWEMTLENQRTALADIVKAISSVGTSKTWGEGRTSSSDGQRYVFPRKVLQRTFSHRMSDYALEFYSFVADNYAPFYSTPIECTDRDAAFVLDGLLYNESDLALEEHYTDTHGYTEINFAAFAMLGKRFCPRIRGIQHQRIYRIDTEREYGSLTPLISSADRTIHLDWIGEQWDRMGQFYASLESGHVTASVALKRLAGFSGKNHFYRANRELGRVFKTEFILQYLSQTPLRRRIRRGLLKGEELHTLARDVFYGKRGRVAARELEEQMNTCSCLTLILACIIYWQVREIERVIEELQRNGGADGLDLSLLEHVSPIGWDNVLLYGQYTLDRSLIRPA